MKTLEELSHAQRERLAFIDFSLCYFGQVNRADLITRFHTGSAAATRDLALYKEYAPKSLELVHQDKSYHRTNDFTPLFPHDPDHVLVNLARGFGDGLSISTEPSLSCLDAIKLNKPTIEILSVVMRSISQKKAIAIQYVSLSSGHSSRTIVPHSLANNGNRWHIRAYDRKTSSFRDFVITRIQTARVIEDELNSLQEGIAADKQWNRIVDLTLIVHPQAQYPEAIELDYAMANGQLEVECRAALVGYFLNRWGVDCSETHHLDARQYHLALLEPAAIFGVENANLAPGYRG
ncbi:MAG: WYL domain-containing protein [Oceanospirillum sp.]|nr:WYL domain-containing protein [Oceanospirillum sp.]